MHRHLTLIDSPVALAAQRLAAARANEIGHDILTLTQLAVRLAGGFCRAADQATLGARIAAALKNEGFLEIEPIRQRPGMTRAVLRSLQRAWDRNVNLADLGRSSDRCADLARIEREVIAALPSGVLTPPQLRDIAVGKLDIADRLWDEVTLQRLIDIVPLWRPLVAGLAARLRTTWITVDQTEHPWFTGKVSPAAVVSPQTVRAEVCLNHLHEVRQALRWARELMATGQATPDEIAIVAVSPADWDGSMLALGRPNLPLAFAHGLPALDTAAGQSCAALADLLINGLSQVRWRRFVRLSQRTRVQLPDGWGRLFPAGAALSQVQHWEQAMAASGTTGAGEVRKALMPMLALIEDKTSPALTVGEALLDPAALSLWRNGLRVAPPSALPLTLRRLKIEDDRDFCASIVWGPAADLVGAPRKWMRFLGLTARSWPRGRLDDPLLPERFLVAAQSFPGQPELDRRVFSILRTGASKGIVYSRALRTTDGGSLAASPLWAADLDEQWVADDTPPRHAFSSADRLLARPGEAATEPQIAQADACWSDWSGNAMTAHDGLVRAEHPMAMSLLASPQSATSLRRLLRDPLGFLLQYGLDLRVRHWIQMPPELDRATFGELTHDLVRATIMALEPAPGLVTASSELIEETVRRAAASIVASWPLGRAVPPLVLWQETVGNAAERIVKALTVDGGFGADTQSFSEVSFGAGQVDGETAPWPLDLEVRIGTPPIRLTGRIDRVDIHAPRQGVRISDYKSAGRPPEPDRVVLAAGAEVQRTLYAMALRQLRPDLTIVQSRLVYLVGDTVIHDLKGDRLAKAEEDVTRYLDIATSIIRSGQVPFGPEASARYNDLRILLPADAGPYLSRKAEAFAAGSDKLVQLWSMQ